MATELRHHDDSLLARFAAQRGTPFYLYDLGRVRAQYARLREAMPGYVDICYAMKANPHPDIARALVALGSGLEVASQGELALACSIQTDTRRIAFAGPAKRDVELRSALELGVVLNVESLGELERANTVARSLHGDRAEVSLRVSPPWGVDEKVSIIGGYGPSKFGIELEQVSGVLARARELTSLRVTGIHVFNASNVLSASALAAAWARVLDLGIELAREGDFELKVVDLGGGLGVPYVAGQEPLDVEALGRALGKSYAERFGDRGPRVILEPGRFLAAESGVFVTRVLDRKSCRGREFVLCDGGINHFLRPALIGQAHPAWVVGRAGAAAVGSYDIGGPLCTSLDFLGKDVPLASPRVGDLIAFSCAGAYGFTESMLDFLSHPRPLEIVIGAESRA